MAELVQCPSCETRYGLSSTRVRKNHRRAQCYRCGSLFPITDVVSLLYPPPHLSQFDLPEPPGGISELAATIRLPLDMPPAPQAQLPLEATEPTTLTLGDLEAGDEEILEATVTHYTVDPQLLLPPAPPVAPPSAYTLPELPLPSPAPSPTGTPIGDIDEQPHYASALDAISKIYGAAAPPAPPEPSPVAPSRDTMIAWEAMEKTLSGLEQQSQFQAAQREIPPTAPLPPVPPPPVQEEAIGSTVRVSPDMLRAALGHAPLPPAPPEPPPPPALGQTTRLSVEEMQAALGYPSSPESSQPTAQVSLPDLASKMQAPEATGATVRINLDEMKALTGSTPATESDSTVRMDMRSALLPPPPPPGAPATMRLSAEEVQASIRPPMQAFPPDQPPPLPPPPPMRQDESIRMTSLIRPSKEGTPSEVMDPNLLKVKIGTEIISGMTMDMLVQMVDQGKLLEFNMVARQFSENWLEAVKVPGLRPAFERRRAAEGPKDEPQKRSLFSGLFRKS